MDTLYDGILYKRNNKRFDQIKAIAAGFSDLYIGRNIIQDDIFTVIENYANIKEMPVHGLQRIRFFTGSKIAAINFQKIFRFRKGTGNYAQNPVLC